MCQANASALASAIQVAEAFNVVPKVPGVDAPLLLVFLVLGSTPLRGSMVVRPDRTDFVQRGGTRGGLWPTRAPSAAR